MDRTGIQHLQCNVLRAACGFFWIFYVKGTRRRRQRQHHSTVNILIHLHERGKWNRWVANLTRWPHAHRASDKNRNLKWKKKFKLVCLCIGTPDSCQSWQREKARENEMRTSSVWMSQIQLKKGFKWDARRSIVLPGRKKSFSFWLLFFLICNFLDSDGAKQVHELLEICSYRARSKIMVALQMHYAHCGSSSICQVFGKRMGQYCLRFVEHCHQTIKMSTTAYLHWMGYEPVKKNGRTKIKCKVIKSKSLRIAIFAWKTLVHDFRLSPSGFDCCRCRCWSCFVLPPAIFFHYKNVMLSVLLRLVLKWPRAGILIVSASHLMCEKNPIRRQLHAKVSI